MKKILGIVIALLIAIMPIIVNAEEATKIDISKYKTLNLKETLAEEEIKADFSNYSESDDQVNIYMFRGRGCGYCRAFLNFINSITDEYGKYFKIVSFETWYDDNNNELLKTISSFMGETASGVPYIIIGDQVFPGYASSYDEGIKAAITQLYDSTDRYDVFEEYNKSIEDAKKAANASGNRVIAFNLFFIIIATGFICFYVNDNNKKLYEKLTSNTVNENEYEYEVIEPEREAVKKVLQKIEKENKIKQ